MQTFPLDTQATPVCTFQKLILIHVVMYYFEFLAILAKVHQNLQKVFSCLSNIVRYFSSMNSASGDLKKNFACLKLVLNNTFVAIFC